jgi:hypothetical protein
VKWVEVGRQHTYHTNGPVIDIECPPDNCGVSAEEAFPYSVAEYDDIVTSRQGIRGFENAAELRLNAERAEKVGTNALPPQLLSAVANDQPSESLY